MERITLRNSSPWNKSVDAITILVVDDDTTCLSIVAAILKKFRYEVVTVKHPNDALCTLRVKEFDLVVSDVHMPDMNGFELQQAIAQEFNLPVVLMSADDEEGVALKGLERGAAFFILKPVSPDDVRDLWQFASLKKTSNHQVVIEENNSGESAMSVNQSAADQTVNKRKSPQKEGSASDEKGLGLGGDNSQSASTKKPKVIWTNSLHNRFLEAIRSIGLDRAVPKKILEVMNVPGLTRENVASHLQKYRIFLRRVSDASYKIQYSTDNGLSRKLMRPTCESSSRITSPPSTLSSNFNQNQLCADAHSFPNLETNFNLTPQSGYGQSRLLSNRGWSWPPPNTGIHQKERLCARLAQNDYQTPPSGPLASISLEDVLSTSFDAYTAAAATTTTYDHVPSQNNEQNSDVLSSNNFKYKTNYVGYSLSNIQNLTRSTRSEAGLDSTNLGDSDQIHEMPNNNMYNAEDQLGQLASSNGLLGDMISKGQQLCDVIEDYGILMNMPSNNPPLDSNDHLHFPSSFTPIFHFSELDIISNAHQQPVDQLEEELDAGFLPHDQVHIQNHTDQQKIGTETSTNSHCFGDLSHWENLVLSFDQSQNHHRSRQCLMSSQGFGNSSHLNDTVVQPMNKTHVYRELTSSQAFDTTSSQLSNAVLPLNERDDDEFLESLLAPIGEDHTLAGII